MKNSIILSLILLAIFIGILNASFGSKNGYRFTNCTYLNCPKETEKVKQLVLDIKDKCFLSCQVKGKIIWDLSKDEKTKVFDCFKKNDCDAKIFTNMMATVEFKDFIKCANKNCSNDL